MASFLYRVGRAAFLHRRLVLGLWVFQRAAPHIAEEL